MSSLGFEKGHPMYCLPSGGVKGMCHCPACSFILRMPLHFDSPEDTETRRVWLFWVLLFMTNWGLWRSVQSRAISHHWSTMLSNILLYTPWIWSWREQTRPFNLLEYFSSHMLVSALLNAYRLMVSLFAPGLFLVLNPAVSRLSIPNPLPRRSIRLHASVSSSLWHGNSQRSQIQKSNIHLIC